MSPRTGRPIEGESRRDIKLQIRVDKETLNTIDECAERLHTTRSGVVREGIHLIKGQLDDQK